MRHLDPHRYFVALRCAGYNPHLWRTPDGEVKIVMDHWRKQTPIDEVLPFKNPPDRELQNSFIDEIAKSLPIGGFAFLGFPVEPSGRFGTLDDCLNDPEVLTRKKSRAA
jgi:hypothetical protein